MSSIPLKNITDLYVKCVGTPNKLYRNGNYTMYITDKGEIMLRHYGTIIFHYDPKKKESTYGGAFSVSDRDAINSIVRLSHKGNGVYIQDYGLYRDGTGPRYEKKSRKSRRK